MASFSPLRGIRVVDFSTNLPGPYCTRLLHNLGAEVIKVEPPGGDPGRELAGNLFAAVNRGKRSIALDLKDDADRDTAHTIVRGADVLVESFRPGVMTRLGMGPDLLLYCARSTQGWCTARSPDTAHMARITCGQATTSLTWRPLESCRSWASGLTRSHSVQEYRLRTSQRP